MFGDPLTNALMGTFLIVVIGVFPDHSLQMPAMKNNGMVQTFSSQAAHEPFAYSIGSWRSIGRFQYFDA